MTRRNLLGMGPWIQVKYSYHNTLSERLAGGTAIAKGFAVRSV